MLGKRGLQRKGYKQSLAAVRADLGVLKRYATDARYRTAVSRISAGLNQFVVLDDAGWKAVNSGRRGSLARAPNVTLNAEATPDGRMVDGVKSYLRYAKSDQTAALASAHQASVTARWLNAEESSASTEEVSASTEQTSASAEQIAASA